MATIKINNVTALTESSGVITLDSAVTGIPAAGVTGVLPVGVTGSPALTLTNATFPAGHVLQTVSSTYNGRTSGTNTTPLLPHADCSVSITPSHASNKILITVNSNLATTGNSHSTLHFFKDSSEISGAKNGAGSSSSIDAATGTGYDTSSSNVHQAHTQHSISTQYCDTAGSTSPITYDFRVRARYTAAEWFVNRCLDDGDDDAHLRSISTITVQEIKV